MAYESFTPKKLRESYQEPVQSGRCIGYCAARGCGMMLMPSDDHCPKCLGTEVTRDSPDPSPPAYTAGRSLRNIMCAD